MKKTLIAIAILAIAISAQAQLSENVDITQPKIVEKIVGNRGKVSYGSTEQVFSVGIDNVDENGQIAPAGDSQVAVIDVAKALVTIDPSVDWETAIPLIYQAVFQIAVSNASSPSIAEQVTTPVYMPKGIEVPVVVLQSETNDYGIGLIAADDGTVLTYIDHQSPRPSQEEIDARRAAAVAKHKANKSAGVSGVNGQLQQRIENIERYLGWRP